MKIISILAAAFLAAYKFGTRLFVGPCGERQEKPRISGAPIVMNAADTLTTFIPYGLRTKVCIDYRNDAGIPTRRIVWFANHDSLNRAYPWTTVQPSTFPASCNEPTAYHASSALVKAWTKAAS